MKKLTPQEGLRLLRKNRIWTQEQLAQSIGVSVYTVTRWERGQFKPSYLAWTILEKLFQEEGIEVEKPIRKRD
jgi:transcriptional regulator with XRE-family HTH domain